MMMVIVAYVIMMRIFMMVKSLVIIGHSDTSDDNNDDDYDEDGEVHGNDVNDNDVINIVLVVSLRLTIPRLHQMKCRFYCLSDSGGLVLVQVLVAFLQFLFSSPVY